MCYLLTSAYNLLTLNLFVILLILCVLTYFWSLETYSFFKNLGIPFEKPKFLIGNLRNYPFVSKSRHQFYFVEEIYKKHVDKKYVGMFKFRKPMLMVRDPDICQLILTKHFECFKNRPGAPVDISKDPLSNHLINMHGDQWKSVRSKISPIFTPAKLRRMFPHMMECAIELANELKIHREIELLNLFSQFDLKISGKCILGLDKTILNDPKSKYNTIFKDLFKPTLKSKSKQFFQFLFPQYSKFVETKNISEDIFNFLESILKDLYKSTKANTRHDLFKLISDLHCTESLCTDNEDSLDKSNGNLSESIIMSNIFIFITTGYESTSTTIASVLYELALNPAVQEKVRQEVREYSSECSYDSMAKLHYLDHVICESQRLHPVNTSLSRQCTAADFKLPGTNISIPRGTHICIPTYAMYKDSRYFPEPDKFNPDRFSGEGKNQIKLLLPFGAGPRQCLARCFAMLEIKCVISLLILRFKILTCSKTEIPLSYVPDKLFITPVNGIWVCFEKIDC